MSRGKTHNKDDSITIRSWPKVIFLYPVMATSLICGICQAFMDQDNAAGQELAGFIFFTVFCLNLMVISFEFSRFRTMSIVFGVIAAVFLLLYLSQDHAVFSWIRDNLGKLHIRLSTSFYFVLSLYFVAVFIGVYITTRFNYWVIKSNEILHKEGFLGDVRRFPSPNLRMTKEISDVFEFMLLGAGRMVLTPASEKQSIVLDHVLRVNQKEKAIQDLLSSLSVEIHGGHDHDDDAASQAIGG